MTSIRKTYPLCRPEQLCRSGRSARPEKSGKSARPGRSAWSARPGQLWRWAVALRVFVWAGAFFVVGPWRLNAQSQTINAAQEERRPTTEELLRQAQQQGYRPDLRQGLEGLPGFEQRQRTGGAEQQTDRMRSSADLENLEYNRRNAGVASLSSVAGSGSTAGGQQQGRQSGGGQGDYRTRSVRDGQGNLVDATTGEVLERADGTVTPLGLELRIGGGGGGTMGFIDPRLTAEGALAPRERERLREIERQIQDSVLQNSVFGREIFSARNLTFAPTYNLPTPANYVLGGGDRIFVDLWGEAEANYDLRVSPDGVATIPYAGVVHVGGLTVAEAERKIRSQMRNSIAGLGNGSVELKLSLGDIRSIKVNIIGEASMPGTYTLPSLATLFNALYEAGGVSEIGSLRAIRLIRGGRQVAELDVYQYLLEGKQEVNVGLQDNDLIVVQPYEQLVKVTGKVKRPRIYELRRGQSAAELLSYTGGFMGEAYKDNLTVARKAGRMQTLHTVQEADFEAFTMADGDSIHVGEIIRQYANRVSIEGAVWRPGDYELCAGLETLKQLISKAEGIRGDALMSRTVITRLKADYSFEVLAVDLQALLSGQVPDVELRPEDLVHIPSIHAIREGYTIEVKGEVNEPKTLLFRQGMTIEDAIVMAGGLKESASLARIEVARRIKTPNSTEISDRIAWISQFNIRADLGLGSEAAQYELQPFDEIFIRRSPGYRLQQNVFAEGELLFGGEYTLSTNNDRLTDLVLQAGGPTPEAYLRGAYLKRVMTEDRFNRQQTLIELSQRGRMSVGDSIITKQIQVGDYYAVVIDLETALKNPDGAENLLLERGDRLVVPKLTNTVTISGAVLYPTTVTFVPGMKIRQYITRGGGYAVRAKKRPFIVYANGLPQAKQGGKLPNVEPGCEIVVPSKPPRGSGMSANEVMSLATSTTSLAAMVTTLFK